tara:strand:+ start:33139 stop:33579 length:441 start_codon:yes stop_codon:yes gene_type:complete
METKFKETKSKKACMGCPFKRLNTNEKPNPGGSHPFVYLGQTRGPFWLPCHQDKNYKGKGSNTETVGQCRGAAIFRANCNDGIQRPKELLQLEEDKENVFANQAEFVAHYLDEPVEALEQMLIPPVLNAMMYKEINDPSPTKRFMK